MTTATEHPIAGAGLGLSDLPIRPGGTWASDLRHIQPTEGYLSEGRTRFLIGLAGCSGRRIFGC